MSKIHPTQRKCFDDLEKLPSEGSAPAVWTVWKKSSMAFHGTDGFTVYDGKGRLGFRVDNYSRKSKYFVGDIVLMDGHGRPLLTLKPQIFTMHDRWNGFESSKLRGVKETSHLFSVRRRSFFQNNSGVVDVFMSNITNNNSIPDFRCDGCFAKRCCKIWSSEGEVAAVIMRKKVNSEVILDNDVFSLIVNPGFNSVLIMAFVIVMDRMCHTSLMGS